MPWTLDERHSLCRHHFLLQPEIIRQRTGCATTTNSHKSGQGSRYVTCGDRSASSRVRQGRTVIYRKMSALPVPNDTSFPLCSPAPSALFLPRVVAGCIRSSPAKCAVSESTAGGMHAGHIRIACDECAISARIARERYAPRPPDQLMARALKKRPSALTRRDSPGSGMPAGRKWTMRIRCAHHARADRGASAPEARSSRAPGAFQRRARRVPAALLACSRRVPAALQRRSWRAPGTFQACPARALSAFQARAYFARKARPVRAPLARHRSQHSQRSASTHLSDGRNSICNCGSLRAAHQKQMFCTRGKRWTPIASTAASNRSSGRIDFTARPGVEIPTDVDANTATSRTLATRFSPTVSVRLTRPCSRKQSD